MTPSATDVALGRRLHERRVDRQYSQTDIASVILADGRPVSQSRISLWENGLATPTDEQLSQLAASLACTVAWLRTGEVVPWTAIAGADAAGLVLPVEGIAGPVTMDGVACPWPWDPQAPDAAGLGQYHCRYCGEMVVGGMPHPDYGDDPAVSTLGGTS